MSQDNADKAAALPEPEPDETIVESTPEPGGRLAAEATETPGGTRGPDRDRGPRPPRSPRRDEEYDAVYVPAGSVVVTGPSLIAKLGAEAFGTFLLVVAGLGVALYLRQRAPRAAARPRGRPGVRPRGARRCDRGRVTSRVGTSTRP